MIAVKLSWYEMLTSQLLGEKNLFWRQILTVVSQVCRRKSDEKSDTECDCLWHTFDSLSLFGKISFDFPISLCPLAAWYWVSGENGVCALLELLPEHPLTHRWGNCVFTCGVQNGGNMLKLSRFASHILKGKKKNVHIILLVWNIFNKSRTTCGWKIDCHQLLSDH